MMVFFFLFVDFKAMTLTFTFLANIFKSLTKLNKLMQSDAANI